MGCRNAKKCLDCIQYCLERKIQQLGQEKNKTAEMCVDLRTGGVGWVLSTLRNNNNCPTSAHLEGFYVCG